MREIDLTPFGFTPTESRVYEVLLSQGAGTGYAVARSAGLARANAYSALEGLVTKGAARAEERSPKIYQAEPPGAVLARVTNAQGDALEHLAMTLKGFGAPASPTLVELSSPKAVLQLLTQEIGRAETSVWLHAPAEAYPILAPVIRRALGARLDLVLLAEAVLGLGFVEVAAGRPLPDWPGVPILGLFDSARAIIATREGAAVHGHWSSAPTFLAAARITLHQLRAQP
jgi:sugar-specific transcriptional regulator TrmB